MASELVEDCISENRLPNFEKIGQKRLLLKKLRKTLIKGFRNQDFIVLDPEPNHGLI